MNDNIPQLDLEGNWYSKPIERDLRPFHNYCDCQSKYNCRKEYHMTITEDGETCALCGHYLMKSREIYTTNNAPKLKELEELYEAGKFSYANFDAEYDKVMEDLSKTYALERLEAPSKAPKEPMHRVCKGCGYKGLDSEFHALGRRCKPCYNADRRKKYAQRKANKH